MKRKFALPAAAAATLAFSAAPALAGVTTYDDRSAFLAATTGATTDGFENAPTGSSITNSAGYTGAGFTATATDYYGNAGYLADVDSAYYPPYYDWGSGDTMLIDYGGTATFTLTGGATAFGIDLMTIVDYGAPITVSVLGVDYVIDTADYPNRTFFGLTSDTPITSFTLSATGGDGEFDNFTLASAISSAPEPASWAMMLIGFAGVGAAMRRRKRSQALPA